MFAIVKRKLGRCYRVFPTARLRTFVWVFVVLIQGCASGIVRPVAETDEDPAGSFDGIWQVVINKAPGIQYGPGNWTLNCNGAESEMRLAVQDSVIRMGFESRYHDAYVNQSGKFRFEIPLLQTAEASGTSDGSLDRGDMTLIVSGSLQEGSGFLTWGIAEFANNGCTSRLDTSRA